MLKRMNKVSRAILISGIVGNALLAVTISALVAFDVIEIVVK